MKQALATELSWVYSAVIRILLFIGISSGK